jgi:hypothetical protein
MLDFGMGTLLGIFALAMLMGRRKDAVRSMKPTFFYEGVVEPEPYEGAPAITNRERLLRDAIDVGPTYERGYSNDKARVVTQTMRRDPEHELWPAYMNKAVYWRHHPLDQQK